MCRNICELLDIIWGNPIYIWEVNNDQRKLEGLSEEQAFKLRKIVIGFSEEQESQGGDGRQSNQKS